MHQAAVGVAAVVCGDGQVAQAKQGGAVAVGQRILCPQIDLADAGDDGGAAVIVDALGGDGDDVANDAAAVVQGAAVGADRVAFDAAGIVDRAARDIERGGAGEPVVDLAGGDDRAAQVGEAGGIERDVAGRAQRAGIGQDAGGGQTQQAIGSEDVVGFIGVIALQADRGVAPAGDVALALQRHGGEPQVLVAGDAASGVDQRAGVDGDVAAAAATFGVGDEPVGVVQAGAGKVDLLAADLAAVDDAGGCLFHAQHAAGQQFAAVVEQDRGIEGERAAGCQPGRLQIAQHGGIHGDVAIAADDAGAVERSGIGVEDFAGGADDSRAAAGVDYSAPAVVDVGGDDV